MHPQIRQSEQGQCPICGMDLIPAARAATPNSRSNLVHLSPQALALGQIQTTRVERAPRRGERRLSGKVEVDERRRGTITAAFPGRIEKLHVNHEGQVIRKGEPLATVYSPELAAAHTELLEAVALRNTYPDLLDAARQKLRLWKLTPAQIMALEQADRVQYTFDVLAEMEGTVMRRRVSQGDYVSTGSVLYEIADLDRVWVMLDAYESDLPFLGLEDEVEFHTVGLPGESYTARISYLDPVLDPRTRTARVRAEASNVGGKLRPGAFVSARIMVDVEQRFNRSAVQGILPDAHPNSARRHTEADQEQPLLAIPRTALLWTGRRSLAYVQLPGTDTPTFELREITLGPRMGEQWLVVSGLKEGEVIVSNGVFALDAAAQLSGQASMMNQVADEKGDRPAHAHLTMATHPNPKATSTSPGIPATGAQAKSPATPTTGRQEPPSTHTTPATFRRQITDVAEAYFSLKNALVDDNTRGALQQVAQMRRTLAPVDETLLTTSDLVQWRRMKGAMEDALEQMSKARDLAMLREPFQTLSNQMVGLTETFGLAKDTVYKAYCPMAFDNRGAIWLSETQEILNPYFGPAMLSCGQVTQRYPNQ